MTDDITIEQKIEQLAVKYSTALKNKIDDRVELMKGDNNSHYLIYRVLGITDEEGALIDIYQNKGRFLYKYAGSFLEEATLLCFKEKYPNVKLKQKLPNKLGQRPTTFEMDCLLDNEAFEIKWKDATIDGDYITKEHTRLKNIKMAGYTPVRIMFYFPMREQAMRIQQTLKTLYDGMDGKCYFGEEAWNYVQEKTGVDLKGILTKIADRVTKT